jgi:hypothetical protein
METKQITSNKRLIGILLAVPGLLLIPFIAMKFTSEVKWNAIDFITMGILLLSAGLTFEFIMRKVKTTKHRIAFGVVLFIAFFLIWAELAVGIFGTPFAGN